ncbi:hypothetical protein BS47DRAFT_1396464 [Hydnum rufescens UP504]|uniref:Uncharacterized protein n=1 Tax=Hydnum rufescens UP504 TaxID=1448309 RepID=A0A9P6AQ71_9AGAM|nr:hypothetical protein BS47DRAFT_1396464 [Hydnum rufescens UP504]
MSDAASAICSDVVWKLLPQKIQILKDRRSCHARCKHAQAYRWNNDVLPSLLRPFMKVMQERFSKSARSTGAGTCRASGATVLQKSCALGLERALATWSGSGGDGKAALSLRESAWSVPERLGVQVIGARCLFALATRLVWSL